MYFGYRFEKWIVVANWPLNTLSVQDTEEKTATYFDGDEATEKLAKLDEFGISGFLDWFYLNELDLSMNEYNHYPDYNESNPFTGCIQWLNVPSPQKCPLCSKDMEEVAPLGEDGELLPVHVCPDRDNEEHQQEEE